MRLYVLQTEGEESISRDELWYSYCITETALLEIIVLGQIFKI